MAEIATDEVDYVDAPQPGEELSDPEAPDSSGFTPKMVKFYAEQMLENVRRAVETDENLRKRWIIWRQQFDAEPGERRGPSALAAPANTMPPLAQSIGQAQAAFVENYFSVEPFFPVTALRKANDIDIKDAKCLTNYLDILWKSPSDLDGASKLRLMAMEATIMGRAVVKVPFTTQEWRYKQDDPATGLPVTKSVVWHQGPEIVVIPQEDIYYPKEWDSIHLMPWIIHEIHLPEHELKAREAAGVYTNVEEIIEGSERNESTEAEQARDRTSGRDGEDRKEVYDILECYFYCDADKDGFYEDHLWTLDKASGTVLRREYNTFGQRPFKPLFYMERPHEQTGRGTGQTCEYLQLEAKGWRDVRSDNAKISAMRMFKGTKDAVTNAGEKLYSGKMFVVDELTDIEAFQVGDVYPSSLQAEERVWNDAAQASAMSDVQRGFSDPVLGTRDTFKGQMLRTTNAKGIAGTIVNGLRLGLNQIGMLILYQLVMHREEVIAREKNIKRLSETELADLDRALNVDIHELPAKFAFQVRTADLAQTDAAKLQAVMNLTGTYSMWAQQVTPLAMQLLTPQGMILRQQAPMLWEHLMSVYVGSTKLLREQMRLSGFDDAKDYLPATIQWEVVLAQIESMQEQMLNQGGVSGQRGLAAGGPDEQPGQPGMGAAGGGLEASRQASVGVDATAGQPPAGMGPAPGSSY